MRPSELRTGAVRIRDEVEADVIAVVEVDDGDPRARRPIIRRVAGVKLTDRSDPVDGKEEVPLVTQRDVGATQVKLAYVARERVPEPSLSGLDARGSVR